MTAEILPLGRAEPAAPIDAFVTHHHLNGAWGTTVTRVWPEKDRPTCGGLCDPQFECTFRNGVCQFGVSGYVPAGLCPRLQRRATGIEFG